MFCTDLRTNSNLQHKPIGFYNPDEKCLQRGTDWVFKYSGLRFVFRRLIYELLARHNQKGTHVVILLVTWKHTLQRTYYICITKTENFNVVKLLNCRPNVLLLPRLAVHGQWRLSGQELLKTVKFIPIKNLRK